MDEHCLVEFGSLGGKLFTKTVQAIVISYNSIKNESKERLPRAHEKF